MATQNSTYNPIGLSDESHPLDVLSEDKPLLTKAKQLRKAGGRGWNKPANFITPLEGRERRKEGKNYGFALGHGTDEWNLVAFDVEMKGVLPKEVEALIDEHALLVWDSVHSGRNRLVKVTSGAFQIFDSSATSHDHLSDSADDDLELQTSGHCIGPGCEIAHKHCKDTKNDCPGTGRGTYELVEAKPLAPVITKDIAEQILDVLGIDAQSGSGSQSAGVDETISQVPTYNDNDVAVAETHLKTFQVNYGSSFHCLSDRLNGGTGGKNGLHLENGLIDRSATDFVTVSDLYGIMLIIGNEDEQKARELAYAYYTYRCEGNEYMKSSEGRHRKWLSFGDKYQKSILTYAINKFERSQFQRWLNQRDTPTDRPWEGPMNGYYADTTRNFTLFALHLLTGEIPLDVGLIEYSAEERFRLDVDGDVAVDAFKAVQGDAVRSSAVRDGVAPRPHSKDRNPPSVFPSQSKYPTKGEVARLAQAIDYERNNQPKSYGNILARLSREGSVKHAFCPKRSNGKRHIYYPAHLSDPNDARWVKTEGEKTIKE